ncbi:MAG: DUF559 domain-containing protein [Sphingomonadales bacterium]|nr:DUF559 domain-containing protein [Sphingomonadales bacterium]
MTTRKTLGIRADAADTPPDPRAWAATGERLERLRDRARDLRRHPTDAQVMLWEQLSGARLGGVKFTRQAVVGSTIVDFACPSRWIVVEITGAEDSAELAELQDGKLTAAGIRVLRFAECEVLDRLDAVMAEINAAVSAPFDRKTARRG